MLKRLFCLVCLLSLSLVVSAAPKKIPSKKSSKKSAKDTSVVCGGLVGGDLAVPASGFAYNNRTPFPEALPYAMDAQNVQIFDSIKINFVDGTVKLGKELPKQAIEGSLLYDRAVVEFKDKKPYRIRWVTPDNVNFSSRARETLNMIEIRLNNQGRIERLSSQHDSVFGSAGDGNMREAFVDAKVPFLSQRGGRTATVGWGLWREHFEKERTRKDSEPGYDGIPQLYGDYRFQYDEKGQVKNIIYATSGPAELITFDSNKRSRWDLLDKSVIHIGQGETGTLISISAPNSMFNLMEYSSLLSAANKKMKNAVRNVKAPLVDVKKLDASEIEMRQFCASAPPELSKDGDYAAMCGAAAAIFWFLSPEGQAALGAEVAQSINLVKDNKYIFVPNDDTQSFSFFHQRMLEEVPGIVLYSVTIFSVQNAQRREFKATHYTITQNLNDKTIMKTDNEEYVLQMVEVFGRPDEPARLAVDSITSPRELNKVYSLKANKNEFKTRLGQLGLGDNFTTAEDWFKIDLGYSLLLEHAPLFLGALLEARIRGETPLDIQMLRPWRRKDPNDILNGSENNYNEQAARAAARNFSMQDIQDFLNGKNTPRATMLKEHLERGPLEEDQTAKDWLFKQLPQLRDLSLKLSPQDWELFFNSKELAVVSHPINFEAVDYYSLLSPNPRKVLPELIYYLDPSKRDVERARKELLRQFPQLTYLTETPMQQFILNQFEMRILLAMTSDSVLKTSFAVGSDLNRLTRLLGAKTAPQARPILFELFPALKEYEDKSWQEIQAGDKSGSRGPKSSADKAKIHYDLRIFPATPTTLSAVKE